MQNLLCPFKTVKITQYDNGSFSHQGSDAWDITDGVAGSRAAYFAPCDVVCKAVDKQFAFTWWQSTNPVQFADGSVDYATIMFGHDNTINCFVGQKIGQGVQLGNMGTGGNATGVHCHIEVAKGKYKGKWYRNPQGVYCLYNSIKFYNAFFMNDVKLINIKEDVKAKFKYLGDSCDEYQKQIATLTNQLVEANKKIEQLEVTNLKLENEIGDNEEIMQLLRQICSKLKK